MRSPRLLIVVLALCAGLLVGEVALRLLLPAPRYALAGDPANRLPGLLVSHPRRGYALAPGFTGEIERDGGRVRVAVGEHGLRGDDLPPPEAAPRILAAGDSFTVGFGVEAEEAWPERLEAHLESRLEDGVEDRRQAGAAPAVANAGVSGYSLRQVRLTVEELVPRLDPALVVVGVYPDAVWRIRNPYVLHEGRLINRATLPQLARAGDGYVHSVYETPWLRRLHHWTGRHFVLGYHLLRLLPALGHRLERAAREPANPQEVADRLAPLLAELDRLQQDLASRGTPWAALLINPAGDGGGFEPEQALLNRVVAEHLRERGVVVVDPLPELAAAAAAGTSLRFPDDHHWSRQAHDLAARRLADELVATGLWPRSTR